MNDWVRSEEELRQIQPHPFVAHPDPKWIGVCMQCELPGDEFCHRGLTYDQWLLEDFRREALILLRQARDVYKAEHLVSRHDYPHLPLLAVEKFLAHYDTGEQNG